MMENGYFLEALGAWQRAVGLLGISCYKSSDEREVVSMMLY